MTRLLLYGEDVIVFYSGFSELWERDTAEVDEETKRLHVTVKREKDKVIFYRVKDGNVQIFTITKDLAVPLSVYSN